MKLDQSQIDHIRIAFEKMQSKADFLRLLNEVKPLLYGDKCVPFKLNQITWYASQNLGAIRYREFSIKKKSGAERSIHVPVKGLKALQKCLSVILQCVFQPHKSAMGFVRDKSIVDNANIHIGSRYVYNIDLKDFFPSIDQARVWRCLQLPPFNLTEFHKYQAKTDIPANNGYIFPSLDFNEKNKDIIKFHYYDHSFKSGMHHCKMKNDGLLTYLIKTKSNYTRSTDYFVFKRLLEEKYESFDEHEIGEILVLKNKSDYGYIVNTAESLKLHKNVDIDINTIILHLLEKTIINHQIKAPLKDGRLIIANIIAALCCTEMEVERKNETGEWEKVNRNVLPQGAPTSPVITNIVCQRLDYLLSGVAKRFGLNYSRYADDITFSSMHNVYQPESEFLKELHRIITEQNFNIKESKTRLQKDGYRKEVTGLLVNENANVQKRYIKQLRMWLYYWERYGYERASRFFLQQYITDKGHIKNGKPDMAKVIAGKLDYLKMVKGIDSDLYCKMKARYNALSDTKVKKESRQEHLNMVINLFINKGLDDAMNIYKP